MSKSYRASSLPSPRRFTYPKSKIPMRYIEPHAHMVSRTTDDYVIMAASGCAAICEPGFWAGMTLYPGSKCSPARAIDIDETYGAERLWMNSACDWGVSIPLSIPLTALEMRRRGHSAEAVDRLIYQNPHTFLSQCPKFAI